MLMLRIDSFKRVKVSGLKHHVKSDMMHDGLDAYRQLMSYLMLQGMSHAMHNLHALRAADNKHIGIVSVCKASYSHCVFSNVHCSVLFSHVSVASIQNYNLLTVVSSLQEFTCSVATTQS